ncbi:MAG TPA: TonB-dependent receptor [Allosphingosinicella sp.]
MNKNRLLNNLLATTVICGSIGFAAPAFAQDAQDIPSTGPVEAGVPATSDSTTVANQVDAEDIVVTGSRIPQPNLQSASPVTVINSEEFRVTGTTRTEDLVNSLPQVFAGQGSTIANGSTGTATLNLRGLGAERNLVLVNGRRVVPGDPTSSAVDINFIPAAVIKRVDVLTGGASSVYGADAVTGVVNFVMDTDFEGIRLDTQYSFYQHHNNAQGSIIDALNAGIGGRSIGAPGGSVADGGTIDATAVFGTSFDDGRGHITAYAGYRKTKPILQGRRDYSSCGLSARTAAQVSSGLGEYSCSGSATSDVGSFLLFDSDRADLGGSFTSTFFQPGPNRTLLGGFTPYNFNPLNHYQRPDERYTAGFFAEYEINDAIQPYAEFMFMDDRTVAQIAPSGNFGNTTSINCGSPTDPAGSLRNPLLSASQAAVICDRENLLITVDPLVGDVVVGQDASYVPAIFTDPTTGQQYVRGSFTPFRRNVEGGARQDDLQHTSYRAVLGSKGKLDEAWSYDAYYQYGRTIFAETYTNDFSITRLGRALDVVTDANGNAICRSVRDGTDPNCVPYNILTPGGVTDASVAYLSTPGFQRGIVSEQVASASLTGQLGKYGLQSPLADEGVGIAVGAEYRKERLEFMTDTAFQTGDLSGQGAATLPVSGSFDVKEVFGELRVPLVHENFIHDLSLTAGYRYSDYGLSTGGGYNTDTYKIEAEFAPIRDIRFRGGYNRAVRAPTVQDLFAPQRVVLDGTSDPCAGFVITAADQACLLQGLDVGDRTPENPASQYNGLIGGNPDLIPESADTYTVGVVLQPTFLPRFALSVDYFNIKLKNAVTTIGADTILNACEQSLDPDVCGLINRDPSGSLWLSSNGFVTDLTQNIGGLSTSGIDVNGSYTQPIGGLGSLSLSFVGTWLDKLETDTGLTGTYDCVGLYGNVCGTPNPEWRHTARLSWNMANGLGLSLRWRHFGSVQIDATDENPNLNNTSGTGPAPGGVARPGVAGFGAQNYFDLAFTARIGDHYNFRLGVNNLLDRDPPVTGSQACPAGFCNGNTFSQVYDALGRYIYAGVTLEF